MKTKKGVSHEWWVCKTYLLWQLINFEMVERCPERIEASTFVRKVPSVI